MNSNSDQTTEEYIEIAEKVRSGEYFRDARAMADLDMHDPMSERYVYIFITIFSLIITFVAIIAWQGLYPLRPRIPFIFATNDIAEDYPQIRSLLNYIGEKPDPAIRRFLAEHYVRIREDYDAALFDRNHNAVQSLSGEAAFNEYEKFILPLNPESPISLYQRHTTRKISIISTVETGAGNQSGDNEYRISIIFDAVLQQGEQKKPPTRHQVDIAFKYKDIKLDTTTGTIEPYGFIVTSYNTKNL